MRRWPTANETIGMVVMVVGVIIASDSKSATPGLVGGVVCIVGLVIGLGPAFVYLPFALVRWLRKRRHDETTESHER